MKDYRAAVVVDMKARIEITWKSERPLTQAEIENMLRNQSYDCLFFDEVYDVSRLEHHYYLEDDE